MEAEGQNGRCGNLTKRVLNSFTLPPHSQPKTHLLGLLWSFFTQLKLFFLMKKRLVGTAAMSTELFPRLSTSLPFYPIHKFLFQHVYVTIHFSNFFCPCGVNIRWKLSVHDRENRGRHWSTHFKSCCLLSWQPVNKLCHSFFTSTWEQHLCEIWYY